MTNRNCFVDDFLLCWIYALGGDSNELAEESCRPVEGESMRLVLECVRDVLKLQLPGMRDKLVQSRCFNGSEFEPDTKESEE